MEVGSRKVSCSSKPIGEIADHTAVYDIWIQRRLYELFTPLSSLLLLASQLSMAPRQTLTPMGGSRIEDLSMTPRQTLTPMGGSRIEEVFAFACEPVEYGTSTDFNPNRLKGR